MGDPGPKDGVINSPGEARQAVRQRYKDGLTSSKLLPQAAYSALQKMVPARSVLTGIESDDRNGPGLWNAGGRTCAWVEGMKRAVLAGVATIEHGTKMTEEVMDLMKQKGTFYVPTITAGKFVAEQAKIPDYYRPSVVPKALEIGP